MMKLILLNGLLKMRELRLLKYEIVDLMAARLKQNNFEIPTAVWLLSGFTEATSVSRGFALEDKNWFTN